MLTVEELKALEVGDWVWIEILEEEQFHDFLDTGYYRKSKLLDSNEIFDTGWHGFGTSFKYKNYGKTWLAYKNKEEAEGKSITLPCKVGDTVYTSFCGVYSFTVEEIDIYKDKILIRLGNEGTSDYACVNAKDLGKEWFFTEKEAQSDYENRLKELKNNF